MEDQFIEIVEEVEEVEGAGARGLIDGTDWKYQSSAIDGDGGRMWFLARKEKPSSDGKKHWLYYYTPKKPADSDRKIEMPHGYTTKWMPYLAKE